MRRTRWQAMGLVGMVPAALGIGCSQTVDLGAAAPQAAQALRSAFPDAQLVKASSEPEGGVQAYEATLMRDNRSIDVHVTPDGTLIEVETEVAIADVPAPVAETVKKLVGDGQMTKLEKVEVRGKAESGKIAPIDPPTIFYEVKFRKWGLPGEEQIAPDGTHLTGH